MTDFIQTIETFLTKPTVIFLSEQSWSSVFTSDDGLSVYLLTHFYKQFMLYSYRRSNNF